MGSNVIEQRIAAKIKKFREAKGLTLAELGQRIGLSKSMLSRIENNQSSPPIATLSKIAQGLGVPIAVFFEDEQEKPKEYAVTRKDQRRQIVRPGTKIGFSYFSLSGMKTPHIIDAFVIRHPPVKKEPKMLFDHPGEELIFVLKGQVELVLGDTKIRLEPGDAVHFDSSQPHRAQTVGDEESECLAIIVGKTS